MGALRAIRFVGLTSLIVAAACASFSSGDGSNDGSGDASIEASTDASDAQPLPPVPPPSPSSCDGGFHVSEGFESADLTTGWGPWKRDIEGQGALSLLTSIEGGPPIDAPPAMRAITEYEGGADGSASRAGIVLSPDVAPRSIHVEFDIFLGAAQSVADVGCFAELFANQQELVYTTTLFNAGTRTLHVVTENPANVDASASSILGDLPTDGWRHLTLDMTYTGTSLAATATLGAKDASSPAVATVAPIATPSGATRAAVTCGITFAGLVDGKVEVAMDNVDVTICP